MLLQYHFRAGKKKRRPALKDGGRRNSFFRKTQVFRRQAKPSDFFISSTFASASSRAPA